VQSRILIKFMLNT